jgi:hypothetical protein
MRYVYAIPDRRLDLGKTGTTETTTVRFCIDRWAEEYEGQEYTVSVYHRRSEDGVGWPVHNVSVTQMTDAEMLGKTVDTGTAREEGQESETETAETEAAETEKAHTVVEWLVDEYDTAYDGRGKCDLCLEVDGKVAKSITWITMVEESVGHIGEVTPPPYQTWVDRVMEAKSTVIRYETMAKTAKAGAETAQAAAEEARDEAEGQATAAEAEKEAAHGWALIAQQKAGEAGYARFWVNNETGKAYVTVSKEMDKTTRFAVNTTTGKMEVTIRELSGVV